MCVRFSLFGIAIKFKWFRVRTISIVSLAIFKCAISSPLAAAKKTTTTKTTCQQQPQLTHKSFSSGKCKLCNSQKMLPCNFCCHIFVVATLFSFAYLCFFVFVFLCCFLYLYALVAANWSTRSSKAHFVCLCRVAELKLHSCHLPSASFLVTNFCTATLLFYCGALYRFLIFRFR